MMINGQSLGIRQWKENMAGYPLPGIVVAVCLILLAPFTSAVMSYIAFVICLVRVLRNDPRVFATDYCILTTVTLAFRTAGGVSLQLYLGFLAALWYFAKGRHAIDLPLVLLTAFAGYLLLRMQMQVSDYFLIFGQLFILRVIMPDQDRESAVRTVKAFCFCLIISSFYALIFRGTGALQSLKGNEVPAYWGSSVFRFQGLFEDPNYFMSLLLVGIALAIKLRDCQLITKQIFGFMVVCFVCFGILTYSKTFLIVMCILALIYIAWQFRTKRYGFGLFLVLMVFMLGLVVLYSNSIPIKTILYRFTSVSTLSELTTGRNVVFISYWKSISSSVRSFLFGSGLGAGYLKKAPHNIYLELAYYTGVIGLGLFWGYVFAMVRLTNRIHLANVKTSNVGKYVVLAVIMIVYMALHGILSPVFYTAILLALMAMMTVKLDEGV